jgi:hypothetical protein
MDKLIVPHRSKTIFTISATSRPPLMFSAYGDDPPEFRSTNATSCSTNPTLPGFLDRIERSRGSGEVRPLDF